MGNSKSIEQCLLTKQQFMNLRVDHTIDHRDTEGRFLRAKVIAKNGNKIKLHYVGYGDQWDVTINYNKSNASDFADAKSVSSRPAKGELSNLKKGDAVTFRPMANDNCQWRFGVIAEMDISRGGNILSGQVKVEYQTESGQTEKRWTHLDNQYEIRPFNWKQQQQQGKRASGNKWNNNNGHNHNHNHFHGGYNNNYNNNNNNNNNQWQMQKSVQVQRQDQMTARVQLLLDDTTSQVKLTGEYLNAVMNDNKYSKDEITRYNQKVVVGLQCFQMKVDGMRENAEKENINFTDAFKSSAQIIRQFEQEFKSQFGNNKYIMQRLNPCLNYMRCVLQGKSVPQLPYINNYKFDKQTASNVISQFNHATNHVIPDRMNQVNNNKKYYKDEQNKLKEKYDKGGNQENVTKMDFNGLIQDYNTKNIAFGKTKAQQDKIMKQQEIEQNARDLDDELLNGGGNDSDIAAMSEDEQ